MMKKERSTVILINLKSKKIGVLKYGKHEKDKNRHKTLETYNCVHDWLNASLALLCRLFRQEEQGVECQSQNIQELGKY